jgi:hypothetical protein
LPLCFPQREASQLKEENGPLSEENVLSLSHTKQQPVTLGLGVLQISVAKMKEK